MFLVSAIHAIQRKQQSNTYVCLTQAWPERESDALMQVSAMLLVSATYVIFIIYIPGARGIQ